MTAAIRSEASVNEPILYVAFELGKKDWKLALTAGFGIAPVVRTAASGNWRAVEQVLQDARRRFGLPPTTVVVSCYEAGRDGFWIHRALLARGIRNRVVDSASIEVKRRARRMKTDRIDALKLVSMLVRVCQGEMRVWSEVRVPTVEDEARRHVSRERTALLQDRTRLMNQMRSWLATYGCALPRRRSAAWWTTIRDGSAALLPDEVQARLARTEERLALIATQVAILEAQQRAVLQTAAPDSALAQMVRLKGVAVTGASILLEEGLVWRAFQNRRQIGGLLGFAPMKYDSGESSRDQGISRAGNARLQAASIQLAWNWVQWQPDSALTRWYRTHFGPRRRARRLGIVAVARKLIIALWRYVTAGVVPAGAVLKAVA